MKFLLDTNVLLWGLVAEEKLNASAQEILKSSSSELYFSAAGSWEIAIKYALGALSLPKPPSEYIPRALRIWAVRALDITHEHALSAGELPGRLTPPAPNAFDTNSRWAIRRTCMKMVREDRALLTDCDPLVCGVSHAPKIVRDAGGARLPEILGARASERERKRDKDTEEFFHCTKKQIKRPGDQRDSRAGRSHQSWLRCPNTR